MLKTSPAELSLIMKKEEYEYKYKIKNYNQSHLAKDHLPFSTMKLKIAAQMLNAEVPSKPKFVFNLDLNSFKEEFLKYYKKFRDTYALIAD